MKLLLIVPELCTDFTRAVCQHKIKKGHTLCGLFDLKTFNETEALDASVFIYFSERVTGKEMMGKGDVVLIFLLGSFMCIQEDLLALLLSSSIAMIYGIPLIKKKQLRCFPFAPAICLAYLMMLLYDTQIMRFYLSLFQK